MHFFLQIDAHGAVGTNHLVRADAGPGRHISARIANANVGRVVAHRVVRAFNRGGGEFAQKILLGKLRAEARPGLRGQYSGGNSAEQGPAIASFS